MRTKQINQMTGVRMKLYKSVDELIGNTPLLELTKIEKETLCKAKIIAKLEYLNPAGSVKDRVGLAMINDAEKSGRLKKGSVIIEPTSGNTGIGLASIAASRGYKCIIVMPDTMSRERVVLMKAYGADVVLSPGAEGMAGAIRAAEELQKANPGSIIAGQFVNPSNPKAHYDTTGPEIWNDTDGRVDILVAGAGTGGTVSGTGKFLKEKNKNIYVAAVEPLSSPVITKGTSGAHKIQGIGANFVPEILDMNVLDEVMTVSDDDAYEYARLMGKLEGILVGISSGAAIAAAVELGKRPENAGKNIVVICPDTGDRYLSTDLYDL